ncbi:amino acid ABC transporter membrane protein (PAAT family) [Humitalea rosea]|uniref:Glutamate/aspartate import permease protein GltK n=1 Tax=Humitalea rosea TaxID=990373 RepID=A0A2W7KDZ2_9PROT|nr:amino acid ABC transporter permease [Humitalea rosea]PZW45920.1 amino acid ABC transporter membrane protein (PAAT family) [Humitalea rosea]
MRVWHWDGFFDYLTNAYLFEGALISLGLTVVALVMGLAGGIVVALLRLSGGRFGRGFALAYCWFFRGTPLLVQLLMIYTALPLFGIRLSVIEATLLGLSLNEAAYLSETVRAGILAVPRGQGEAATALGLHSVQRFRLVVWPQALRIIIPPLGNSVNGLLKTTSIASVISMDELLRRTQILVQEKFLVLELFTVAALYYLLMTTVWDMVQRRLEARFGRGYAGESADRR